MLTDAQVKRQRPGRVTFLAIICILMGAIALLSGLGGASAAVAHGKIAGASFVALLFLSFGGLFIATGIGLLRLRPWARKAGIVACVLGLMLTLKGLPAVIHEHSFINIAWDGVFLFLQGWIAYFLLQPSTAALFEQAQGDDERLLKI